VVSDAWLRLGNCYSARKDYARAAENFAKALDRRPDYEYAFVGYTDALMSAGRTEETISASRRFLRIDPQAALAHHQLGRALFRAKRFEDAERSFSEALRLAPDLAEAAYDIGACREARADFPGAVAEFRRAISIDPTYPEAHAALARRLFAGGDPAGAATELRTALKYDPDNATYARALQDLEKRGIK
jgi:tetratricopeptide (TPR) repeat protein